MNVGIIAPSSVVPNVEFKLGVKKLKESGFSPKIHPQVRKKHLFFAGTHEERAHAFFDYAQDPNLSVLWCARGGYGANHLLPILDELTSERGSPEKKLLVGFSDATALMEFTRDRWGWSTLHGPMLSLREFLILKEKEWETTKSWVNRQRVRAPWESKKLKFYGSPPSKVVDGILVGGNMRVWSALLGTPYSPKSRERILFFEDTGETLSRIDRTVEQLNQAGGFQNVRAIVLGDFQACSDFAPIRLSKLPKRNLLGVLKKPSKALLGPIRKTVTQTAGLRAIFGRLSEKTGIPIAYGLPIGHGPNFFPIALGATHRLHPEGQLELLDWDWFGA